MNIILSAQCKSICKIRTMSCLCIDITQMTMTQYNSSVPQRHQRRLSTVHLDGLSILTHKHAALNITEQQHQSDVLKHVLLTPTVLLSSGMTIADSAGYMTGIVVHVYIILASRSLKLSDDVTLPQVDGACKHPLTELFRSINYYLFYSS